MMDRDVYNPLHKTTYEAIAYNAVGRASEIGTYPAYALVHSTGNSGWSVGIVQWDFGQPGRGEKVELLLTSYQAWAELQHRFSHREVESLSTRLQRRGQVGNDLTQVEKARLDAYLRSDEGREFVNGLNHEQIAYKWAKVGKPLSQVTWLQSLAETNPEAAGEIVAMTSKLFNQNETRGARLVQHLQNAETTSEAVERWIGSTGIEGLNPQARKAIVSGRDSALAGIRLMNALEMGNGPLSTRWREVVHGNGDVALANGFNFNPDLQLFDAMMRNPTHGARIFEHIELGLAPEPSVTGGINALARLEMARVEVDAAGSLVVTGPRGFQHGLTEAGWTLVGDRPAQRRDADTQDYLEFGRAQPRSTGSRNATIPETVLDKVRDLKRGASAAADSASCIADNVIRDAQCSGMTGVTLVRVSDCANGRHDPNNKLIAWQGDPRDPATRWSVTPVRDAAAIDVDEVLGRCRGDASELERSRAHASIQHGGPQPVGPGMH